MYKILKTLIAVAVCLKSYNISAQLNEYLNSEQGRIAKATQTEGEIRKFIDRNFNAYTLSKESHADVVKHLHDDEVFGPAELERALIQRKNYELRKLFFAQNPDKRDYYIAKPLPVSVQQTCVNGDFESGTAGYTFWSDSHPGGPGSDPSFFLSCATPTAATATNLVIPVVNDMNATVAYMDNTAAGYTQYDPTLAGLGVNIPTLYPAGANKCIKLNNEQGMGSSDMTTVSRYFPSINQATLDFNFSLIMDNKPDHEQNIQPYFRARVLDQYGNVVDQICIVANPDNCLFHAIYVSENRRVLYTDWICARLNVGEILNQPGTVEFSVSDCQPSAHFGTVYLDNICGAVCASPELGALNTTPINVNCPDTAGNTPIEVCGTYQPPYNATLSTMTLEITQNNTTIGTINAPTTLTASTFCFSVLPSMFGASPTGDFEFLIEANFNVNCPAGVFTFTISDNSSQVGPDVTFNNCCQATLTLGAPADNVNNLATADLRKKERSNWIKAANIVSVGDNVLSNGVVYHAANFVELNPGFEALLGSQFAAYPEGCSGTYTYRTAEPQTSEPMEDTINLIRKDNDFVIVPNPSSSTIEIIMDNAMITNVAITTIDGKVVEERKVEDTVKTQLDISRYAAGIYIVNVTSNDGTTNAKKLIKR